MCVTCAQGGNLPVHLAALKGHVEVVKYLLELQPDTLSVKDKVRQHTMQLVWR